MFYIFKICALILFSKNLQANPTWNFMTFPKKFLVIIFLFEGSRTKTESIPTLDNSYVKTVGRAFFAPLALNRVMHDCTAAYLRGRPGKGNITPFWDSQNPEYTPEYALGWGDFLQKHASYCDNLGMTHKDKKICVPLKKYQITPL